MIVQKESLTKLAVQHQANVDVRLGPSIWGFQVAFLIRWSHSLRKKATLYFCHMFTLWHC